MVPCRSCAQTELSRLVLDLRNLLVQFFAPFRFVLFKLSAVGSFELRFASLHYRREFRLIFFESFGNRGVGSFMAN
jgi:hypothetical protein